MAAVPRRPPRQTGSTDPLIDAFCDALWVEDGLSRNTLVNALYRRIRANPSRSLRMRSP